MTNFKCVSRSMHYATQMELAHQGTDITNITYSIYCLFCRNKGKHMRKSREKVFGTKKFLKQKSFVKRRMEIFPKRKRKKR